ncbi:MAG: hypothetical protein AAF581_05610 [Planctomycetota bacterium]
MQAGATQALHQVTPSDPAFGSMRNYGIRHQRPNARRVLHWIHNSREPQQLPFDRRSHVPAQLLGLVFFSTKSMLKTNSNDHKNTRRVFLDFSRQFHSFAKLFDFIFYIELTVTGFQPNMDLNKYQQILDESYSMIQKDRHEGEKQRRILQESDKHNRRRQLSHDVSEKKKTCLKKHVG